MDDEYIRELCERADYYGMKSLAEQEQYALAHKYDMEGILDETEY